MAKKQTLKSILGGSDGRVQASLDLGKKSLRPTISAGGQSVTAVQKVQSAGQTQLGMLAASLGKLNPSIQAAKEGYYADAEIDKIEFRETFQGMTDEERAQLVNQKEKELAATEKSINSTLRGEFGLNPLAAIYAEKLVGGSKSDEFVSYVADAVEKEKKRIETLDISERPSRDELTQWTQNLTNSYNQTAGQDGGQLFKEGSLRYRGLLAATEKYRAALSAKLPKEMEDHFKNAVYTPSIANNLRNTWANPELSMEDKTIATNTFLKYLDPLDKEDTAKVFDNLIEGFAVEDSDMARSVLTAVALDAKLGNEPLIQTKLYNDLLEKIDTKDTAYRRKLDTQETKQIKEHKVKFHNQIGNFIRGEFDENGKQVEGTGGIDYAVNKIEELREVIQNEETLSDYVKAALDEHLEAEQDQVYTRASSDIAEVKEFVTTSQASDTANTGEKTVSEEIVVDIISELQTMFPEGNISQSNNPLFTPNPLNNYLLEADYSSDANRIIGDERTEYVQAKQRLYEKVITMNFDTREERADWIIEQVSAKGGIADKFKSRVKKRLMALAVDEQNILNEKARVDKEVQESVDAKKVELQEIADNKLNFVSTGGKGNLKKKSYNVQTINPFKTRSEKASDLTISFLNTGAYLNTLTDVPKEKSEALKNAYQEIFQYATDELDAAEKDALQLVGTRVGTSKVRITAQGYKESVTEYQNIKSFVGYSSQEAVEIIESGNVEGSELAYSSSGVAYDKDYFQNSYEKINFPNLGENPEADTKLASLLGITVDELKASQQTYETKYFIK
jgi:hypothetical protein